MAVVVLGAPHRRCNDADAVPVEVEDETGFREHCQTEHNVEHFCFDRHIWVFPDYFRMQVARQSRRFVDVTGIEALARKMVVPSSDILSHGRIQRFANRLVISYLQQEWRRGDNSSQARKRVYA